jgi:hypothetical protein
VRGSDIVIESVQIFPGVRVTRWIVCYRFARRLIDTAIDPPAMLMVRELRAAEECMVMHVKARRLV